MGLAPMLGSDDTEAFLVLKPNPIGPDEQRMV
jgi:hypothetical protein